VVAARPRPAAALAAASLLALLVLVLGAPRAAATNALEAAPWATVNVCDTEAHPDAVGVRGSMPGTGNRRDALTMRIELQFMRRRDGRWLRVGRSGDSGVIDVGHGDARVRTAGRTFTFLAPEAGRPAYLVRGLVTFEWRRDGELLRRVRRATRGLQPATPGADPPGYSASTCAIR
jgi:hypothetical protein